MSSYPDHMVVAMPALSPTMTMGTIVDWTVAVGDEVSAGDQLGEIETDKATMAFDSAEDGFVAKLLVEPGTSDIPLGTPVCVLVEDEGDVAAFADYVPEATQDESPPTSTPTPEPTPTPSTPSQSPVVSSPVITTTSSDGRIKASPLAKKIAAERSIPLDKCVGTGQAGRITKADVEAYALALAALPPVEVATETAASPEPSTSTATGLFDVGGDFTDLPLSNVRKVIANRLTESKQSIPHYYLSIDVRMDNIMALRKELNALATDGEYKLSPNDFLIKAAALSMKHVPEVNSSWMDTFIREHHQVDVSVAVSTPNGLITPIVVDAGRIGLSTISNNVRELAGRARDGKLQPHEFQGGTFTISNLGMFGVKNFSAIINPPQSCILAVGNVEKTVVVDESAENGLGVGLVMSCTMSCDHRVVDGAVGAEWLKHFKGYLENPMSMLL